MADYLRDFAFLLGAQRTRALSTLGLLVAASLLDLCGIGLVWPYAVLLSQPELLEGRPLWEGLRAALGASSSRELALLLGLLILVVFYAKSSAHFAIHRSTLRFASEHYVAIVERLLGLYARAPYEHLLGRSTAMITRDLNHAQVFAQRALVAGLRVGAEVLVSLSVLALLGFVDPLAAVVLLGAMGPLLWLYDRRYRARASQLGEALVQARTGMLLAIRHVASALKELRVLGTQGFFFERLRAQTRTIAATTADHGAIMAIPRYAVDATMVSLVVLIATLASLGGRGGESIIATLAVFGVAGARLVPSLNQLSSYGSELRFARQPTAELRRALQLLEEAAPRSTASSAGSDEARTFERLELVDVRFTYAGAQTPALDGVSLSLEAGSSIGIVGASGAGKTTLVDVLLGLLVPQEGCVRVDGRALGGEPSSWTDRVAYLPQEVRLIDASVRENVALGRRPDEIDDAAVWRALERAKLVELVRGLPAGLDTALGEDGARLSGGERARIALARAFYFGRQVLVFDEATASLDQATEAAVVEEIRGLEGDHTLIVIAHRPSAVRHCDVILRLEDGRIVQRGGQVVGGVT